MRTRTKKLWPRRILAWVAVATVLGLRRPRALTHAQLWAEDAGVWLRDLLLFGPLKGTFRLYNGYWEGASRLLALAASPAPLRWIPTVYALLAVGSAAAALVVFWEPRYRRLLRSDALRASVIFVVASAIAPGPELVAILTNVQWWLEPAAVLWFAVPPHARGTTKCAVSSFLAFVLGASNPTLVLLLPFVAWRIWRRRGRVGFAVGGLAAGLIGQLVVAQVVSPVGGSVQTHGLPTALAVAVGNRVVMSTLLGVPNMLRLAPLSAGLPALGLLAVACALLLYRARSALRLRVLGVMAILLTSTAIPLALRGMLGVFQSWQHFHLEADRYFFLSAACFIFLVAWTLDRWVPRSAAQLKAPLLLVLFAAGIFGNAKVEPIPEIDWEARVTAMEEWLARERRGEDVPTRLLHVAPGYPIWLPGKLDDPSFEHGEGAWQPDGELQMQAVAVPHSGTLSLGQRGEKGGAFTQEIRLRGKQVWHFSAWVWMRCETPDARVALLVDDGERNGLVGAPAVAEQCGQWQKLETDFTPDWTEFGFVRLYCGHCTAPVLWDDVAVE